MMYYILTVTFESRSADHYYVEYVEAAHIDAAIYQAWRKMAETGDEEEDSQLPDSDMWITAGQEEGNIHEQVDPETGEVRGIKYQDENLLLVVSTDCDIINNLANTEPD